MIGLCSWSLHRALEDNLSLFDFIRLAGEKYKVKGVELCQLHFKSVEQDYLDEVKHILSKYNLKVLNIPVDIGNISHPDPHQRHEDIEKIAAWFKVAEYIGSPFIRINAGTFLGEKADLNITINSYRHLVNIGKEKCVGVLLENHGGASSAPENIIKIMEGVNSPYFRTCPDFGNFDEEVRYEGLRKILPYAALIHAKTFEFDEYGEEKRFDFGSLVRLTKESGFKGPYSVEFEGEGGEEEGINNTIALLEKYLR